MASTTRYRDLLDYTVAYRTIWTVFGIVSVMALAGWLVWSYVKPPGEDERARADVKAAERLKSRAEGCVSPELGAQVARRLEGGTTKLEEARSLLLRGDHSGSSMRAKESAALLKDFIDEACVDREAVAQFFDVAGEVKVKKANSLRWVPARKETQLEEGDKISAERGAARITYLKSGEVQEIRQGTIIEIKTVTVLPGGHVRVVTAMERGDLTMQGVKDTGSITLPSGGEVEPGLDVVDIEAGEGAGEDLVRSLRGGARVKSREGNVTTLDQQTRVNVTTASGVGTVEKDLPGPELATPVAGRVFTYDDLAKEDTILEWHALDGASGGYAFQISVNDRFLFVLNPDSQGIDPPRVSALLTGLPANLYFWRVAGIDGQGVRGHWSEVRRFQIRSTAAAVARPENVKPPMLEITNKIPVGDQVILEGKTEQGVSLECLVNGQKYQTVDVSESGDFRVFVRLPRGGKNIITFVAQNSYGVESRKETSAFYSVDFTPSQRPSDCRPETARCST